jgi:predicted glycoside hydrolase/deacetylase ChbG (UPF0249 family)
MVVDRYLIVNADDFGLSSGVNRGIIKAHEQGIVTSASLMVRMPGAAEAAAYGREHPRLSIGLHFDMGEWTYREGRWVSVYEVAPVHDGSAVGRQADCQLAAFRRLLGRNPSHIDSHQHVHRHEPVRSTLGELARKLDIPLRDFSSGVRYCGRFYGQTSQGCPLPDAISVKSLNDILAVLPPGLTELGCHPGEGSDFHSMYLHEREQEVKTLCDPLIQATLGSHHILLCSFNSCGTLSRIDAQNNPLGAGGKS